MNSIQKPAPWLVFSLLSNIFYYEVSATSSLSTTIEQGEEHQLNNCLPSKPRICSQNTCTYTNVSGCILITEDYSIMRHRISMQNASSSIHLTIHTTIHEITNYDGLVIEFSELNRTTEKKNVTTLNEENVYISEMSEVEFQFIRDEEWIDMVFEYKELMFETSVKHINSDAGIIKFLLPGKTFHTSNGMDVWYLTPSSEVWNESTVILTITSMHADEYAGDYLLVGGGKELFAGPPAIFLSGHIEQNTTFYIANDYAYIMFFYRASTRKKSFGVYWERSGICIKPDKEDIFLRDSEIQAIPICFYNTSWIAESIGNETYDPFSKFRHKFADTANAYIRENPNVKLIPDVRAKYVKIIQVSSIVLPNQGEELTENGVLYVMVTIVFSHDSRSAMFRYNEMEEILNQYDDFDTKNGSSLYGFKVGKCPSRMDYETWYLAASVELVACLMIFCGIWFCIRNATKER